MKNRLPTLLLIICPYLYLLTIACLKTKDSQLLLWIYCTMGVVIFIPNMIYAFVLAKRGENSIVLLFWDMILKICNIPIYIFIFFFGLLIFPVGIAIMPVLIIFDYFLLLPSSMYGVSGLLQARREGKITKTTAVLNSFLHFLFCLDVISAILMFYRVKQRTKST